MLSISIPIFLVLGDMDRSMSIYGNMRFRKRKRWFESGNDGSIHRNLYIFPLWNMQYHCCAPAFYHCVCIYSLFLLICFGIALFRPERAASWILPNKLIFPLILWRFRRNSIRWRKRLTHLSKCEIILSVREEKPRITRKITLLPVEASSCLTTLLLWLARTIKGRSLQTVLLLLLVYLLLCKSHAGFIP